MNSPPPRIMADDTEVLRFYQLESYHTQIWPSFTTTGLKDPAADERTGYRRSRARLDDASSGADRSSIRTHTDSVHSESEQRHSQYTRLVNQIKDWDPLGVKPSVFTTIPAPHSADPDLLAREQELKASFSASNRKFLPRQFLYEVHKDTSYHDLERGLQTLKHAVNQRSVALKGLVQNNFDRFVAARSKIDILDQEIRGKDPDGSGVYGTGALERTLTAASQYASNIYGPIIQSRTRAEKVRNTLSAIERYKFFFNLPHNLSEFIHCHKYEAAVREYKKGKELFQSLTTAQTTSALVRDPSGPQAAVLNDYALTARSNSSESNETAASDQNSVSPALRRIFEKVWMEVEETMTVLRSALFKHLNQPWQSVESQEKVIGYLLEVGGGETTDPVSYYLQSQLEWIIEQLKSVHAVHLRKFDALAQLAREKYRHGTDAGARDSSKAPAAPVEAMRQHQSQEFLRAIAVQETMEYDSIFGKDVYFRMWRALFHTVKQLSDTLARTLPDFWKLASLFVDNQFHATSFGSVNRGRKQRCQGMAEQIVRLYILLVSDVLRLSDAMYDATPLIYKAPDAAAESAHRPSSTASRRSRESHLGRQTPDRAGFGLAAQLAVTLAATMRSRPGSSVDQGVSANSAQPADSVAMHRLASSSSVRSAGSSGPVVIEYPPTHCLITGYFLANLAEALTTTANDTIQLHVSPLVRELLGEWVPTLKGAFLHCLCQDWMADSKLLHLYEDWALEDGSLKLKTFKVAKHETIYPALATTTMLGLFHDLQRSILQALMTIYHANVVQPAGPPGAESSAAYPAFDLAQLNQPVVNAGPQSPNQAQASGGDMSTFGSTGARRSHRRSVKSMDTLLKPVKMAFFGTLYSFLDSLHYASTDILHGSRHHDPVSGLVASPTTAQLSDSRKERADVEEDAMTLEIASSRGQKALAAEYQSNRPLLLTMCNLIELQTTLFPAQLQYFETSFKTQATHEHSLLTRTMRRLDVLLFDHYILQKTRHLSDILRRGILANGFNWGTIGTSPRDIQPYVNEALLFVVFVHAEITAITLKPGPLLLRTLQTLAANFTQEMLETFRCIDTFSDSGVLQASLECDFCEMVLHGYLDEPGRSHLRQLKMYLQSTHGRSAPLLPSSSPSASSGGGRGRAASIQGAIIDPAQWQQVRELLLEVQQRTAVQFRCLVTS
ncbi:Exocyst complex component S5 [Dimargaris xerosporica]|nr:Exocyst complex component S5 [Dimargaris xerosporica]